MLAVSWPSDVGYDIYDIITVVAVPTFVVPRTMEARDQPSAQLGGHLRRLAQPRTCEGRENILAAPRIALGRRLCSTKC